LRLKSAGEPRCNIGASQQPLLPTGGVYLKKSELNLRTIGSAGGRAKTKPPFRPPRLEAEAKRTISSFSSQPRWLALLCRA